MNTGIFITAAWQLLSLTSAIKIKNTFIGIFNFKFIDKKYFYYYFLVYTINYKTVDGLSIYYSNILFDITISKITAARVYNNSFADRRFK